MKINRKAVVGMFVALGYKTAEKWDADKMSRKLKNLKTILEEGATTKDADVNKLIKDITTAQDAGNTVTVTDESEAKDEKKAEAKGADKSEKTEKKEAGKKSEKKDEKKSDPDKKKETPKKAKPDGAKMDRIEAAVKVLTSGKSEFTVPNVIAKADELHAKSGGKSNPKEAAYSYRQAIKVLVALGMAAVDGDSITINKQ